ncbi:MAG: protoporphyrinogen oxidase, partial [Deltaproteobacteria bacterium]|nr:protoporphyrinogen oxidase [Deltaproteobacteria bacterium]
MRVVVVGAGISGLTAAYLARAAGHDVVCVDPAPQAGGLIRTERHDGFLCEIGPQAVLNGAADTTALIAALGLNGRAIAARPEARRRFIYARGKLHPLPMTPPALLRSGLLTPLGKLRLLAEPFVRARRAAPPDETPDDSETVAAFGARRLGTQAGRTLLGTAVIGVYATDAATLSASSAFPRLVALEREHGSLFRGMLATRRKVKASGEKQQGHRTGGLISFPNGLAELPGAIDAALGAAGRLQARVVGLE